MAGVEVATKISELVATNPPGSDSKSEGDNHLRLIKSVLQDVFDDSGDTIKTTLPIESPDGAVFGSVTVEDLTVEDLTVSGALSIAGFDNPLSLLDPDGKVRATIAATETAATGGVAITAFDDAGTPDQEAQLLIGPSVLEYSGDDATKKFQLDLSRQPTATTQKLYMPAKPIANLVPSIWEPVGQGLYLPNGSDVIIQDLDAFVCVRLKICLHASSVAQFFVQLSSDNGATWVAGTAYTMANMFGTSVPGAGSGTPARNALTGALWNISVSSDVQNAAQGSLDVDFSVSMLNKSGHWAKAHWSGGFQIAGGASWVTHTGYGTLTYTPPRNALKVGGTSGPIGMIIAEGVRG